MNISNQWRSLWPISSVFPAPNLPSSNPFGPLLFFPSHSSLLLSSPSLSLQIPPPLPPSSFFDGIRTFFRSPLNDSFLPHFSLNSLAARILSSLDSTDPIAANNLHALHCRSGSKVILFFPTGENSNFIGFIVLSFKGETPEITVDKDGDVFKQREGFKHPYHRILKMSVVPASATGSDMLLDNKIIEGFLIAATLYSVNWFRVETRVSDSGQERTFLVPMAKQGFESSVVDACWSPHFAEESAVLLESGELCWFNLDSKRSGKIKVTVGGENLGGWLSCQFGGQPWILFVACSSAVVMVDLRSKKGTEPKVVARIGSDPLIEKKDRILAFCRSGFNDFHVSVVTQSQLLLFDVRQPMDPILKWGHTLHRPCYVSMFRLSELRPSDEFKWASDSGFVILVGSFWNDEFSIFCYGPNERGAFGNSLLYGWELPSCVPLSGRQCGLGDSLVREIFLKEDLPSGSEWKQRKDVVVGFWIVPNNLLKVESELGGFALIRLMLSGKLEMQRFHASWDLLSEKFNGEEKDLSELNQSVICCMGREGRVTMRYNFFKFGYLDEYMKGKLSNALNMHEPQLNHKGTDQNSSNYNMGELKSNKLKSPTSPISAFISDSTIPTSIFEIASRRVLNSLQLDLLPLAFSKYLDLFGNHGETTFPFLEVPTCLPHHRLTPFFMGKPSRRSEKWSKKAMPGEALVGPVLPLPVLLTLQQMDQKKNSSCLKEGPDDDLLALQCKTVLENVYPEISLADTGNFTEWGSSQELHDEKTFFVYEPTHIGNKGTSSLTRCAVKEELPQMDQTCLEPEIASKDEKFTTFICGIADKTCYQYSGNEAVGFEMLDLSPVRLDFDPASITFQPREQESYKRLKRQFSEFQGNYKPYEDFCISSKIPKLTR